MSKTTTDLLDYLSWLASDEAEKQRESRGILPMGEVRTAMLMCLDFAEEQCLDRLKILESLFIIAAGEAGNNDYHDKMIACFKAVGGKL